MSVIHVKVIVVDQVVLHFSVYLKSSDVFEFNVSQHKNIFRVRANSLTSILI